MALTGILAGALASTGAEALAGRVAAVALGGILTGGLASTGAQALAGTLPGAMVAPTRILPGTLAGALARLRPHAIPPMVRSTTLAHEIMGPTKILAETLTKRLRPHAIQPMARRTTLAHEIMIPCSPGNYRSNTATTPDT